MLALLFLVSIWLDQSQRGIALGATYMILVAYVVFALVLALITWRNWWLDARFAVLAHAVDMAVFTAMVFSTNGYTSPFFLFFILPLLSSAIRWGWRETMLTASALVLLYFTAGLLVAGSEVFELQRFIVRSGHLVILSAVLIWFGIHQQLTRLSFRVDDRERGLGREDPLVEALSLAIEAVRAESGALLLCQSGERHCAGIAIDNFRSRAVRIDEPVMGDPSVVVLFNLDKNRAMARRSGDRYRFLEASSVLDTAILSSFGAREGLVTHVRTGTQEGWLILWGIAELSVDFLELGIELGRAAGAILDRDALLFAIEEQAASVTRLSLARDVHDSVVQFLAGAAFRVEAIMRGAKSDGEVESDLKELKRLLIEEQGELRAFVSALRRDRELELAEAVDELKGLALRLSRQWSVECHVEGRGDEASIPIRLQLDLQQLIREAVANAVRHGSASRIDVDVGVDEEMLRLKVRDNGSGFVRNNAKSQVEPWSLKERVERAHGSFSLSSEPGCTNLVIDLPLTGAAL